MKILFLKISTVVIFGLSVTACDFQNIITDKSPDISGTWENNLKNTDGSSILSTLEVKDLKKIKEKNSNYEYYTYSANLNSKLTGNSSENVKLTTTNINLSGEFRNKDASITDVESENETQEWLEDLLST